MRSSLSPRCSTAAARQESPTAREIWMKMLMPMRELQEVQITEGTAPSVEGSKQPKLQNMLKRLLKKLVASNPLLVLPGSDAL
jgi:hypothetical protein